MNFSFGILVLLVSTLTLGCVSQPPPGNDIPPISTAPEYPSDADLTDSDVEALNESLDELDDTSIPDSGVDDSTFENP